MKKHNVLIVIDAQNDFITGSLANETANERVPYIADIIRDYKWDNIIATFDTHNPDYLHTKEGKKLPVEHCIYNSKGWRLDERIEAALDEVQKKDENTVISHVMKPTFGSLDLSDVIAEATQCYPGDTLNIVMCGFCTDICVVSNAMLLKANFYNIADIKVVANACAGVTEESHNAALKTMEMCQIDIVNVL